MRLRQVVHIALCYTLLFPAGLLPFSPAFAANQEWDSGAVSVGVPNSGVGQEVSQPVSVNFPSSGVGTEQSKPVSITMASATENGTYMSQPTSVSVQSANAADPDLVGLWHMDGDWGDSSGNNLNGTRMNGVTFSSDSRLGTQSGYFDGSNDYVAIGNLYGKFPDNKFTIMGWVKLDSTANGARRTIAGGEGAWADYAIGISNNQLMAQVHDTTTHVGYYAYSGFTPSLGVWYHIAGTYDGSRLRLYVNGELKSDIPAIWKQAASSVDFWIGGEYCCGDFLDGLIDEVSVYKRALTAEEIAFHAKEGQSDPLAPPPPSLANVPPVVGTNTVTLSGNKSANTAIWVNSKSVTPLDDQQTWQGTYSGLVPGLNLLNAYAVDSDYRQSAPASATIIYDNQPPVIESSIPANNTDSATVVSSILITFKDTYSDINTSATLSGATVQNAAGETKAGTWYTSGSKSILFSPTSPLPRDTYTVTVYPVDSVGNRGEQQITFRAYDLTPPTTKISLSGAKGIDGWYTTPVTVTLTADDGLQGSGVDRTEYSTDNGTTWQTYQRPFTLNDDGVTTLQYRSVDRAVNYESAKSSEIKINKARLVGLWHMDNNWQDSSVVGNNPTVVSNATFTSNAKIGAYAGSFNGSNSYVGIPDSPTLRAERNITILGWIYVNAFDKTWQNIFWKGNTPDCTTNCENREYAMWLNSSGYLHLNSTPDDRIGVGALVVNTSSGIIKTAANTPANNGWYHFAAVISSDQNFMKIYVNGVEQASAPYSSADIRDTVGPLMIGSKAGPADTFNGLIDELTIYKRVLTPEEIQENYRNYIIPHPTVDPVPPSVTNVATLDLSGTKPENTAIMINGVEVVSLDTNTTWNGTYTLAPGMNTLNVTAMDADGFHSAALPLSVAFDVSAPNVTSTSPANNGFVNTAVNAITFNLSDSFSALNLESTVSGASVARDGASIVGTWSLSGSGASGAVTFKPLSPLDEGTYTATIYPTDVFLNQSTYTITFTVDSTAPSAPLFDHSTLLTNNSLIIVTGTKTADTARVVLTGTGLTIGAISYTSSTTWSAVVSGLNEGTYSLGAYGLDSAGNQSGTNVMTIVVDRTAPGKPTVTYPQLTKETTVTLSGSKPPSTYLYVNSQQTSNAFAATSWSYTVSLSEGSNQFSVYTKDEAGNASEPVLAAIVRDTTPPVIGASAPAANSFVNSAGTISATLTDNPAGVNLNASLTGAGVKTGNTAVAGSWAVSGGDLVFTPSATLGDGYYTVTLNAADLLDNKGPVSFSFTLDTGLPTVQSLAMNPTSPHKAEQVNFIVTFSEDMLTSVQPTLSFTRGALYSTYAIPGGTWTGSRTWQGSYTFTPGSGDGAYSVTITGAKDKSGNMMADKTMPDAFVLDTTAPPAPGVDQVTTPTNVRNQILKGSKETGSAIFINGTQRVAADVNTSWSYNYPLAENTNTLNVTARDAAGNDSAATTATIVLDTTPPVFTVNAYQNPSPVATQTLTGTKEPNCIVKVNSTQIYDSLDSSPTWTYTVSLTSGITNHFVFTAADALGNTTTKAIDILYDNAPPAQLGPGVLVADGSGKGNEVTLSWTAYPETTDVAYYAVYKSSTTFTDVTGMDSIGTANKGTKTYNVKNLTQGSTYYFAVVPVDRAGNQINTVNVASAVPTDTVAPEDVTKLAAAAGYTSAQGNFVTVTWTPSVNSTGDLADQVVYFDGGTGYDSGTPLGKTATTYTKTGLNDATKYKFKITVKDTLGHESQGAVVEAVTRLSNPTNLTTAPANGKVVLTWSAVSSPYVKAYRIYRALSNLPKTDISQMTFISQLTTQNSQLITYTDTGLTNDTTYQYAVTALNTSGAERTDVQSVSGTPRADSTGPVIDTFNVIAGQVVTAPITVSATAHDLESTMGSMELSIDGNIVATQAGGSISYFWNVVATTDGNHTVTLRATDSRGNATEDSRQVIVSLAPPAIPTITGHVISQTTPTYLVNVSGTAPLFTTVTLKVNGVVVGETQTAGTTGTTGTFGFSSIALTEGENALAAKASHRGGESAYTPDYKILVDTGAPPAPQNLATQVLAGGLVRSTWTNGAGEMPASYNLYVSTSPFTSRTDAGVTKTNTSPITYQYKEYNPGDDNLKYYAVTAVDAAGNESPISNVVSVSSDRIAPSVSSIVYTYTPSTQGGEGGGEGATIAGLGTVKVSIVVSEPLKELPFFSLEPQEGSPIVVTINKVDDTHYEGTFAVTAQSPQGATTYKFSGKDMVGNRGSVQGTGITIDVKGPDASIQSPVSTLHITPDPVSVNFALTEPAATTPVLQLKASDGTLALVTDPTSTDNGIHWTGTLNISSLPEGKAEFILSEAKDALGNNGTTVTTGRYILLYLNSVPSPGIPDGLAAKSGKGGAVTLTWYPVANPYADLSTLTYNLYRRAEGETSATKIQTGIGGTTQNATTAQDIPPADGTYYYSVTSVGMLGSESPASAEVQAVSDRTGPPAPQNLSLSLGSGGITATWDPVTDVSPAGGGQGVDNSPLPLMGYNLYRSNAAFTSSTGLTPVSKSANAMGIDTSPSKTYRFYAVAAVDSLGNEGPLSDCKEIDFPVSPVRNLVLQRIDDAAPTITWQSPQDGSISGYYIYRNGSRITSYPVSDLSYTDGYAVVNTTYGVSAVDNLGNESPIKTVTLPDLAMGLKDGTTLRRGILETLQIILTSGQGSGFTIDSLDVKIGTAPTSSIQGPFALGANTTLQLEKIAATTADADSPVSVFIQANWSPSPGVAVKVSRTTSADVLGSSSSLEIFNDPLVRNTDAKVHLKLNNIGTAQMEIVTSENNGVTHKVRVNLKDEDGNVLSTGYLDQRIGSAIVNGAGYAVARINPNESFTTDPILLSVPDSAPNNVVIEAVIDNTYYHYSKPDQVTAPGMTGTAESIIQDTPYHAIAAPEKTFYAMSQPVLITGSAISNDPAANGQLVPNVPVKLGISVNGFDRFYTVTTDASGKFSYTFTPESTEAGNYSLWAVHPDVKDRTVQATFSIAGISINPTAANVRLARSRSIDIPVTISNYGGGSLTGLTFETTSSNGISAGIINTGDTTLTAGEKQTVTLRLSADSSAPDTGWATMKATTAEGLSVTLNASITMVELVPVISASPSYIDTGMVRGDQKIAGLTITNSGEDTLRNAYIDGPSTPWMTLTQDKTIGDIAPGASKSVSLMFSPPSTLAQAVYDDQIVIYSDNHIPYTYHIQVTVSSNAVGNVYFDVMNELMEKVPDATITFQNQVLTDLIYTVKTGADGTASKFDIPEGRYIYNVSPPPGHLPYSSTFTVTAGTTVTVPIALAMTLVDVTWSVVPTTIQDQYDIQINQTFETNVPAPVLVVDPPNITLPEMQPGESFNGEFTVTNYGLIAVFDVKAQFPTSFGDYDIEVLTSAIPDRIEAMQKITVPYKVTRRQTVTAYNQILPDPGCNPDSQSCSSGLFDDLVGWGGACYDFTGITIFGTCIICPHTEWQRRIDRAINYIIGFFTGRDCSGTVGTTGTTGSISIGGPGPGQATGGGLPGSPEGSLTGTPGCGGTTTVTVTTTTKTTKTTTVTKTTDTATGTTTTTTKTTTKTVTQTTTTTTTTSSPNTTTTTTTTTSTTTPTESTTTSQTSTDGTTTTTVTTTTETTTKTDTTTTTGPATSSTSSTTSSTTDPTTTTTTTTTTTCTGPACTTTDTTTTTTTCTGPDCPPPPPPDPCAGVDCSTGMPCVIGSCVNGGCTYDYLTGPLDDCHECQAGDSVLLPGCGDPCAGVNCDTGMPCVTGTCVNGQCTYNYLTGPLDACNQCQSGDKVPISCTGSDKCSDYYCDMSIGCTSKPKDCTYDDPCVDGFCNATTGGCDYSPRTGSIPGDTCNECQAGMKIPIQNAPPECGTDLSDVYITTPTTTPMNISNVPAMPPVTFHADVQPLDIDLSTVTFSWYLTISFQRDRQGQPDVYRIPESGTVDITGSGDWSPDWGSLIAGGDVHVYVTASTASSNYQYSNDASGYYIYGTQPDKTAVANSLGSNPLKAICCHESDFKQFSCASGGGCVAKPYPCYAHDGGYGLMMPTWPGGATSSQVWDWTANVAFGVQRYANNLQQSRTHLSNWNCTTPGIPCNTNPVPNPPITMTDDQHMMNAFSLYRYGTYYYGIQQIGTSTVYQLYRLNGTGPDYADSVKTEMDANTRCSYP